jgi:hypothetical protein
MQVGDQLQQIFILLDQNGFVASLEKMAGSFLAPVEPVRA